MAKAGNTGGGGSAKSKVVAGMVIGIVLGVAFAGFVAWYVLVKNPASFTNKELREPPKVAPQVAPAPMSAPVAASNVGATTKFEFYKELSDKPAGGAAKPVVPKSPSPEAVNPPAKAAVDATLYLVQAGSFQNADDAEKLKAKLALVGMEASVQKADITGKGVFYRVRLGPYEGMAEANAAIANLKQNGISNATALHAQ